MGAQDVSLKVINDIKIWAKVFTDRWLESWDLDGFLLSLSSNSANLPSTVQRASNTDCPKIKTEIQRFITYIWSQSFEFAYFPDPYVSLSVNNAASIS